MAADVTGTECVTQTFGTKELPRLGGKIVLHSDDPRSALHKEPEGMSGVALAAKSLVIKPAFGSPDFTAA